MAFKLYSTNDGHVPAWEYVECSAIAPKVGMAMALNESGQLVASQLPTYVCMREEEAAVAAGTKIPVVRIAPDQVWENVLYTDVSAGANAGDKVDLATSGIYVDGAKSVNANFEITYAAGSLMGDVVRGRFVK